jgi:hypothetical protein
MFGFRAGVSDYTKSFRRLNMRTIISLPQIYHNAKKISDGEY